jgi:hypothetical protein
MDCFASELKSGSSLKAFVETLEMQKEHPGETGNNVARRRKK